MAQSAAASHGSCFSKQRTTNPFPNIPLFLSFQASLPRSLNTKHQKPHTSSYHSQHATTAALHKRDDEIYTLLLASILTLSAIALAGIMAPRLILPIRQKLVDDTFTYVGIMANIMAVRQSSPKTTLPSY
jgi:hypothetical protein